MYCKYWTGSSHHEGHRESKRHPKSIILVGSSSDVENTQKPTQFNPGHTLRQNNGKCGIIKKRCVSAGRPFNALWIVNTVFLLGSVAKWFFAALSSVATGFLTRLHNL